MAEPPQAPSPAPCPLPRSFALHPRHNEETHMQRVTGIGGIFIKARDPERMKDW